MSPIATAVQRRRTCLYASSFLVPVLSLGISAVNAQQPASPNLLPSIEVEAPADKSRTASKPASQPASASRRVVPTAQQAPPDAQQSGTAGKAQLGVGSAAPIVVPMCHGRPL